jgi:hypothetical protein
MLYPAELLGHGKKMERVVGIEPAYSAWKADALPLSYTRTSAILAHEYISGKPAGLSNRTMVGVKGFEPICNVLSSEQYVRRTAG